jgi:hypothetical protein
MCASDFLLFLRKHLNAANKVAGKKQKSLRKIKFFFWILKIVQPLNFIDKAAATQFVFEIFSFDIL